MKGTKELKINKKNKCKYGLITAVYSFGMDHEILLIDFFHYALFGVTLLFMVLLIILQSGLYELNFLHFLLPASMLEGAILLTCSKK